MDSDKPQVDKPDAAHSSTDSVPKSHGTQPKQAPVKPPVPKGAQIMTQDQFESPNYPKEKKQGRAVIICNKTFRDFKGEDMTDKRKGAKNDMEEMERCLRKLGFDGISYEQKEQMVFEDKDVTTLQSIMKTASQNDYTDYGCFLCVILSFGEPGVIFCKGRKENEPCEMKTLQEPFKDCVSLRLKPKIFLIQGCPYFPVDKKDDPGSVGGKAYETKKIPRESDFLIHFSSEPGSKKWKKDEKAKSAYITCLSKAIEDFCINNDDQEKSVDFLKMLTRVNNLMVKEDKGAKVPLVTSLLTKKIYFYKETYSK